jgi:hypothetical protein
VLKKEQDIIKPMSVSEELDYYSKVYINEESIDQNSNND